MENIINDFDDVRLVFPEAADNSFENIEIYLKKAKRKILEIFPEAIYDIANYEIPETEGEIPNKKLLKLKELFRECIVYYAFFVKIPLTNATLSEQGLQVAWNDKFRPMKSEDVKEYVASVLHNYHTSVEDTIKFLNDNKAIFTAWADCNYFKRINAIPFKSSADFSDFCFIDNSARFFFIIIPYVQ